MSQLSLTPVLASSVLLASFSTAQRPVPPPEFQELRKSLPDLPWVASTRLVDLDRDGDLDALVAVRPPTWLQPELLLFANDGHASFARAASVLAVRKDPGSTLSQGPVQLYSPSVTDIAIADVDGDGDEDALLTSLFTSQLLLLPNVGAPTPDGTLLAYETGPRFAEYTYLWRVVAADVDADGHTDALLRVSRFGLSSVQLARGTADGRFLPSEIVLDGMGFDDLEATDLDGDRKLDLVLAQGGVRLFFGDGTGGFTNGPEFPDYSYVVAVGDIDGDRDLDIVSNQGGTLRTILNEGGRSFVEVDRSPVLDGEVSDMELIDVDRDLDLDLASGAGLLLNDGSGNFSSSGNYPSAAARERDTRGLETGDLDADGDPDLVLVASNRVLLGDGAGHYEDTSASARVQGPLGELADLDGDGDLDGLTVAETYPAVSWSLLSNDGRGEFLRTDGAVTGTANGQPIFGDLDGDGDLDALLVDGYQALTNDGDGAFSVLPSTCLPALAGYALDAALGDIDGDGDLDAVQGRGGLGGVSYEGASYVPFQAGLWRNEGSGCFRDDSAQLSQTPDLGLGVALGDVDLDGDADLLTSQGTLFTNSGNGLFLDGSQRIGTMLSTGHRDVALGDLDGDGALDACFGGEFAWNDGSGAFPVHTPFSFSAWRVGLGDLNLDGRMDVVTGALVRNGIRGLALTFAELHVNQGARTFSRAAFPATDRLESALGDVDGDGDLDFVDGRRTFFNLHRSLAASGTPRIGHPLALELSGRPRAPFLLFASRSLRTALPTPLGTWHLDATQAVGAWPGTLGADGRAEVRFDVPRLPALIGRTLYWQAASGVPARLTAYERTTLSGS